MSDSTPNVESMACKICGGITGWLARQVVGLLGPREKTLDPRRPAVAPAADTSAIPINHSGVKTVPDELADPPSEEAEPAILPIQRNLGPPPEDEQGCWRIAGRSATVLKLVTRETTRERRGKKR